MIFECWRSVAVRSALLLLLLTMPVLADEQANSPSNSPVRLRLAFTSNRDQYLYPRIVIYDHDGHAHGKVAQVLSSAEKRLDHQPSLSGDGRLCAFGWEAEAGVGQVRLWDLQQNQEVALGEVNADANTVFSPSLSAAGDLLALTAWNRAGATGRWDVLLWNVSHKQWVDAPGLNSKFDERRVALSGDGKWLAFTTNHPEGQGLTDIWLYDLDHQQIDRLPQMNSAFGDNYPALSHDGRWLAFISQRSSGAGGMDVYLFDRQQQQLVDLPGLNSPGQEQTPSLSGSGRYVAFVSERFDSGGEHDIFLYDRQAGKLLETPGLNTARDEYDPMLIELDGPARKF